MLESGGNAGSIETPQLMMRLPLDISWNLAETPARLKLRGELASESECNKLESGGNAGSIETKITHIPNCGDTNRWNLAETPARLKRPKEAFAPSANICWNLAETPARLKPYVQGTPFLQLVRWNLAETPARLKPSTGI